MDFDDFLLAAAARGALVLTATRRLSRRLRRLFDGRLSRQGCGAWATPMILAAEDWLRRSADLLDLGWRLLDGPAARRLWERIIEEAEGRGAAGLLQVASTARLAENAHLLLAEYRLDPAVHPLSADHASFLRWRAVYLETCRRQGWLDLAALGDRIAEAVERRQLAAPGEVVLAGFDELSPGLLRQVAAFRSAGARVTEMPPPAGTPGRLLRRPCADAREEVRRAACWARDLLQAGEADIGIVVPGMESYRPLVERIFREEIDPQAALHPGGEESRFSLSLGAPLAGTGAVAAALEILAAAPRLPLPQVGFLLRTPYLGGAERERGGRAGLERKLRGDGQAELNLAALAGRAGGEEKDPRAQAFSGICRELLSFLRDDGKRLPGSWAGRFAALLSAVGWPGERPLDSHDYQVVKAWHEKILARMAAFDAVSGPVGRGEALSLLRRLAAETVFQPEGPESPVQVVGLLEAAGLRFRHLWVMGLHDGVLPAPPRPNPFLPVPLQVAAGLPHASAEREAAFARRVAERLFAAAPLVLLSHPLQEGDSGLLPSPLIRSVPAGEPPPAGSAAPVPVFRRAAPAAEVLPDVAAPPLAAGEPVSGGTAILRDQALCPFRAFARHRLQARALETPDLGLDAGERGSLLHRVMELFWRCTGDQAGLLALGQAALDERLREVIEAAVAELFPQPSTPLLRLEKERLLLLVREWLLEVEARRSPFAVLAEEKSETVDCGGLALSTRIDRLDRLPDGRVLVLDYKTGQVEAADLVGERLLEPQLPAYGLRRSGELAAVAFASLRRGRCAFAGVAAEAGLLPKVPAAAEWGKARESGIDDWDALLARWREQLQALGRAFAAGAAAVDPADPKKACGRCDLAPLCRIAEGEGVLLEGGGG